MADSPAPAPHASYNDNQSVQSQANAPATGKASRLHWYILVAMALGAIVGAAVHTWWTTETWNALGVQDSAAFLKHTEVAANDAAGFVAHAARFIVEACSFLASLFLRLLRMTAVPVVIFSLIAAVAGVGNAKDLGKLGGRTIAVFAATAIGAVLIALAITNLVKPGTFVSESTRTQLLAQQADLANQRIAAAGTFAKDNSIWTQLLNAVPTNPFTAMTQGDMLQLVVFAMLVGVGLTLAGDRSRTLAADVSTAFADGLLRLVGLVLKGAPIAVFCITASLVGTVGVGVLQSLAVFVLATVGGLAAILFIQYPLLLWITTRRSAAHPQTITLTQFFRALAPAQLLAFSSSSSAATLPVTMECCDRLRIPKAVTRFVCPLGTTINMDGTALYQVMCVTFLAQLYGIDLSLADQILVAAMAILVAIGSPGLPGASIVLMVFILQAVNVPVAGLAVILAVDRVLDMARTVVNVTGDAVACVAVCGGRREEGQPESHSAATTA